MNLLSADTHNSSTHNSGSGVFTPAGPAAYYHNVTAGSTGALVVADIDIKPSKTVINWAEYATINAPKWE